MKFDALVEEILKEQDEQLNEGLLDIFGPEFVNTVIQFVKALFNEHAVMALGLMAGQKAFRFLALITTIMQKLKPMSPELRQAIEDRRKGQFKKLVSMYENDPEVMEIIRILNTAKTDKSKKGIAARKEATVKLKKVIIGSHVFAKNEPQGRHLGFKALKKLGAHSSEESPEEDEVEEKPVAPKKQSWFSKLRGAASEASRKV